MIVGRQLVQERLGLALLVCLHAVACCVSLICAAYLHPVYHILYDPTRLLPPIGAVAAFSLVGLVFVFSDFSFGYFVGFYFYSMVVGYLWENCFSDFSYNHQLSGLSAAASAVAFLLPALFIRSPLRQIFAIPSAAFDRILLIIILL